VVEGASPPAFPVDLRGLLEYVAERLDAGGPGKWRILIELEDGSLRCVSREDFRIPATALAARFGPG
jgi:hypothetical protein